MKEIVTFTDTSRKYYGFDEHSLFLRKRLREVWDLIHLNKNIDLNPEPFEKFNYKKYSPPYKGVYKINDGHTEYEGDMLGYGIDNEVLVKKFRKAHGKGTNYYRYSFICNGYWRYDFAHGRCIFLNYDGEFFIGVWQNGKLKNLLYEGQWSTALSTGLVKTIYRKHKPLLDKEDRSHLSGKLIQSKNKESINKKYIPKIFGKYGKNEILSRNMYCDFSGVTDGEPDHNYNKHEQSIKNVLEIHEDNEKEFYERNYKILKKEKVVK
jgi:hypothetical protein|tara:strand:+ start:21 stop:815 length:795 start_codon:yes stop_codon:yes gene_type:complete